MIYDVSVITLWLPSSFYFQKLNWSDLMWSLTLATTHPSLIIIIFKPPLLMGKGTNTNCTVHTFENYPPKRTILRGKYLWVPSALKLLLDSSFNPPQTMSTIYLLLFFFDGYFGEAYKMGPTLPNNIHI